MTDIEKWNQKRSQMKEHKHQLIRQGSIQTKNGPISSYYVVRWREQVGEKTVKRTIYLGDSEMAIKAQTLLDKWRREDKERRQREAKEGLKELILELRGRFG